MLAAVALGYTARRSRLSSAYAAGPRPQCIPSIGVEATTAIVGRALAKTKVQHEATGAPAPLRRVRGLVRAAVVRF